MTQPRISEEGVEQHLFIDEIHQYHVCQHTSCRGNRAFEKLVRDKGAYYVAQRIMRREAYRKYDSKYPFDSTAKAIPLDEVQDTLGQESNFLRDIIADEMVYEFMETLSPLQQYILQKLLDGYAPKDIAQMRGKDPSKSEAERWHKNNIKNRLSQWREERE